MTDSSVQVGQTPSLKIWAPLGRLTYAAYLIHPLVIFGYYLNLLQPLHFSDWVMVNIFLSNLVITYALSFVICFNVYGSTHASVRESNSETEAT